MNLIIYSNGKGLLTLSENEVFFDSSLLSPPTKEVCKDYVHSVHGTGRVCSFGGGEGVPRGGRSASRADRPADLSKRAVRTLLERIIVV